MATPSHTSVIVVGGGIVGLCVAVTAKSKGYDVTVIDRGEASASEVAAGMIAPALEALNEPDPVLSYARLKTAQAAWHELEGIDASHFDSPSLFLTDAPDVAMTTFKGMGANVSQNESGLSLHGEGLVDAQYLLQSLRDQLNLITEKVDGVTATTVHLTDGRMLSADKVVVAGGYAAHYLAKDVPSLACLTPIKGHILSVPTTRNGVTRAAFGYLAAGKGKARIGATMQTGQADTDIEPDKVAALVNVGERLGADMSDARAFTGVRASTPDNWPLIGLDKSSGVWVATGMRRNGFIFAPFAAKALVAAWTGVPLPEAEPYNPNRFLKRH